MKRIFTVAFVLIWVVGFCAVAPAAERSPKVKEGSVSIFDMNEDGVITVQEFRTYWRGYFKDLDTDADGKVTAEEFTAGMKKAFADLDKDGSGDLVAQEVIVTLCGADAKVPKKVKKGKRAGIDRNRDKKISKEECAVFWLVRFNGADKDMNGKITMEEFLAGMNEQFKKYDRNQDGYITIQEIDLYWSDRPGKAKKSVKSEK
ncbi:MAG: hypothetical protein PHG91_12590 [Syntrophales bacterium]|nr:hypothetical protein [Syntrophales bacterium]MDD5533573.1 hypothetical protein [Syntrophales bacterium]